MVLTLNLTENDNCKRYGEHEYNTFGSEITVKITFGQTQKLRFTVLLFGQVTKVFGLLYSFILQSQIRSSFFSHLN